MGKLTAYQKLKAENKQLKQDIFALIELENARTPGDMIEHFKVKNKWSMRFELEKNIWFGKPSINAQSH